MSLLLSNHAFAADFLEVNLAKRFESIQLLSLYGGCGASECRGIELTVPARAEIAIEEISGARCSAQVAASLVWRGGNTYIIRADLRPNAKEACIIKLKNGGKEASIRIVNESAAL